MAIAQAGTELQQFLQEMLENLVNRPDQVRIVMSEDDGCVTYDVRVHPVDEGRLIGKGGLTAKSIRTIVNAMAALKGIRCELNLPARGVR